MGATEASLEPRLDPDVKTAVREPELLSFVM